MPPTTLVKPRVYLCYNMLMVKKVTFKKTFKDYLNGNLKFKKSEMVAIFLFSVVLAGFLGFVWEFSLEVLKSGFKTAYITGGNFLPWINIYALGAILVGIISRKTRKNPLLTFIITAVSTGILELIAGWLVFVVEDGTRYWYYGDEWWGWGHINGFVCPVSALIFGIGSMFFVYLMFPFALFVARRVDKRKFLIVSVILFSLIMVDEATNYILRRSNLPYSRDFYLSAGFTPRHIDADD